MSKEFICKGCGQIFLDNKQIEEDGYCFICHSAMQFLEKFAKDNCNQSLTGTYEVKYDYDEDEDGETIEQVIVDNKKYIDIEYFARVKADLEKALELAVADKCTFENKVYSMVFGIANGKLACPKKEQWYLEKAKERGNNE